MKLYTVCATLLVVSLARDAKEKSGENEEK
jgi:hypothetical protein